MEVVDKWGAENFDGHAVRDWLASNIDICVYISAAYLTFVFCSPAYVERFLPPTKTSIFIIKKIWMVWNIFVSIFSFYGAMHVVPAAIANLTDKGLKGSMCDFQEDQFYTGKVGFAMGLFALSKFPEFIDTVFLIFTGKYKLPFLSWFHHVTTFLFAWMSYQAGSSIFLYAAAMNYSVHTIMYFYFAVTEAGFKNLVRPFAIYITLIQIAQMVVGMLVSAYVCWEKLQGVLAGVEDVDGEVCTGTNFQVARCQLVIYIANFYLFSQMFYNAHVKPRPASADAAKKRK